MMLLDHCVSLLISGESKVSQAQYDHISMILFKLETGVDAKRLDSIKTSLMMIEVINLAKGASKEDRRQLFTNFVSYTYRTFREPIVMAIMKYAIADRKLAVQIAKKGESSESWDKITKSFKPSLLDNSTNPTDVRLSNQFTRCYSKIKRCSNMSDNLKNYLSSELSTPTHTGSRALQSFM